MKGKNIWMKGRKLSIKTRLKFREAQLKRVAEGRHNNYKGGITGHNLKIRSSLQYRLLRESVFKRDNYICQICKSRGKKLNADHILPFAYFPAIRFAIDNGRTLCINCHKNTDTFKGKAHSYKPMFVRWIRVGQEAEVIIGSKKYKAKITSEE